MYSGDIRLEDTIDIKFTTRKFSTGAPSTLGSSPVISAYIGNSTTQITAGITLSVDFDGVTGLNNVRVVATAANGYTAPTNVTLVITTGTVDSVSVVGEVIGSFSIEARSALMPTTPARTLDVSSGGEAGLDWANIGSPTTAQNLSATNIDVDQVVASVSGAVGSVTAGVTVTTNNDKTGYGLSATAIQAIWDAATSALTTVGSIGKLLVDNINATISSRLAPTTAGRTLDVTAGGNAGIDWANVEAPTTVLGLSGTTIKAVTDGVTVTTNNDKTGYAIGTGGIAAASFAAGAIDNAAIAANAIGSSELAQSACQEIADEVLDRDIAGGASGGRTVSEALKGLRNRVDASTGTMTVYEEDDTTPSWTAAVTRSAVNPIVELNP